MINNNNDNNIPTALQNEKKLRLIFGCSEKEAIQYSDKGADGGWDYQCIIDHL